MEGSNHLHTLHRSLPFLAMSPSLQLEKYVTQECLCAVKIVQNPNSKTEESLIEKKQHPTRCRIHAAYCVMLTADADYAKYILVALKMFQLLNQCICGTSLCGTQLCERSFKSDCYLSSNPMEYITYFKNGHRVCIQQLSTFQSHPIQPQRESREK